MKKFNKEKETLIPEENHRFLQRLRDENEAFIKLIKQLEEHDSSDPKPTVNHNHED